MMALHIGDVIHGDAGGWVSRDHYDCARIEAMGPDWIMMRNFKGGADGGRPASIVAWNTQEWAGMTADLERNRDNPRSYDLHSTDCPEYRSDH